MQFRYVAYTEDKKIARGVQAASSVEMAAKTLAGQGYKILSLKPAKAFLTGQDSISKYFNRISPQTLVTFSRQLALLHESGVDVISSLELLKAHLSNRLFKKVINDIIIDLNKGIHLSEAMSRHPDAFSKIYIQSIKMGEQTGNLELSLKQMADYTDKEARASKSVQNALRYPLIVAVVALIVVLVLATYVLPAFLSLYKSLNAAIPASTQALMAAVDWFSSYGIYTIMAILMGILLFFLWTRTPDGRLQKDQLVLRIPVLGRINHLNELVRCCRSISILYKAGLPVPEILRMAIEGSSNMLIKQALSGVHQSVLKGEGLAKPMAGNPLFLSMMVQMAGVGEKTGNLDKTLMVTAETYEMEAEEKMHSFVGLIQPAITIVMGIVVALIAISLISAMYSMYGNIG